MLFSVWNSDNYSVGWDEVVEWAQLLEIETVPVLYRGRFDVKVIEALARKLDPQTTEGFVIRNSESYHFEDFAKNTAKYVRENHVTTDKHWMFQEIIPNGLRAD
jgi:hypothetical protein